MKKITDKIYIDTYHSKALSMYFGGKSYAVFDIETTGLSPRTCHIMLSGILIPDKNQCQVIQFFAEKPEDEYEILVETQKLLAKVDYIITYNGRHFDIPFVTKRSEEYGLSFDFLKYNLDLYLIVNGHAPFKEVLPNLKQKSLEAFMGLSDGREDEISGSENVALYNSYLLKHSFDLEQKILLHNHDDIIQLYRLLPVIDKVDFHKAMFKLGFPAGNFLIQKVILSGRDIHVHAVQLGEPCDYILFPTPEQPYSLTMNRGNRMAELSIPGEAQAGAIFFDVQAILGKQIKSLEKYPAVINGYLIIEESGILNYMEINAFLLEFFRTI